MGVILFDAVQANRKSGDSIWITLLGRSPSGRTGALMVLECTPETARHMRDALSAAIKSRLHSSPR